MRNFEEDNLIIADYMGLVAKVNFMKIQLKIHFHWDYYIIQIGIGL